MKTERRCRLACQQRGAAALCYAVGGLGSVGGERGGGTPHKAALSSPSVAYLGDEGRT